MKQIIITTIIFLFSTTFYGQSDSIINEFNTKRCSFVGGISYESDVNFKVYRDSLIQTFIGKSYKKTCENYNIPVKSVYLIKLKNLSKNNILFYKFEEEFLRIQITSKLNITTVLFKVKDDFSGVISDVIYYY